MKVSISIPISDFIEAEYPHALLASVIEQSGIHMRPQLWLAFSNEQSEAMNYDCWSEDFKRDGITEFTMCASIEQGVIYFEIIQSEEMHREIASQA